MFNVEMIENTLEEFCFVGAAAPCSKHIRTGLPKLRRIPSSINYVTLQFAINITKLQTNY